MCPSGQGTMVLLSSSSYIYIYIYGDQIVPNDVPFLFSLFIPYSFSKVPFFYCPYLGQTERL